jgi:hypothetical protein
MENESEISSNCGLYDASLAFVRCLLLSSWLDKVEIVLGVLVVAVVEAVIEVFVLPVAHLVVVVDAVAIDLALLDV